MKTESLNLLLIEDNPGDVRLVQEILIMEGTGKFSMTTADCLENAQVILEHQKVEVILLDLQLPDGNGLDTLLKIHAIAPGVPIVVLSNISDERLAVQSVQRGAQDFLVKNHVNGHMLLRSLSYAIERKYMEERLHDLAHHDSLTGLANRKLFYDNLKTALASARRHERPLALLLLDLDEFKPINDTYGHHTGDQLLQEVARRLRECVRETDSVARMGGDEFTVTLTDIRDSNDAAAVARKILDQIEQPFHIGAHRLEVHASIGISLFPDDADHMEDLVHNADIAMYRAKGDGGNTCRFYSPEMHARAGTSWALEEQLQQALASNEFFIHYQPQVNISSGRIIGMESLLRWQHPQRGPLLPAEFIGVLEGSTLALEVGEWVLRHVCTQGSIWCKMGLPALTLSVNVSHRQLMQEDFAETVAAILEDTGFDPQNLELDVSERALWEDEDRALKVLNDTNRLGVRLALDNFGSGRASFHFLRKFPFHSIKLDRSLTQEASSTPDGADLARAVIQVAHVFRMKGLAGGVETASQLSVMRNLACDDAQGHFYCLPVPTDVATDLLMRGQHLGPVAAVAQ
jgi:diguanylate cyclase (GGDEF)-like protein